MRGREASIAKTFNGTVADEREILAICFDRLGIGERQVARASTSDEINTASDKDHIISYMRGNLTGFSEETLADFLAKSRERYPIDPDLNPGGRLTCLSDEEYQGIFEGLDGWKTFHQRFPGSNGRVAFSRAGFDPDMTRALMYASHYTGWLSGISSYLFFSKLNGAWSKPAFFGGGIS